MNKRYLITPSLYNSYIYYVGTDFEKYGDKASEIEAKAKQDFINCLSKIYTSNEILERGIAFENSVNDICNGLPVEPMENAKDVADICFKKTQAMYCITVLKMLYNFGFNKGIFTKNNPFANLRIKKNKPKKFVIPHEHVKSIIDKARELGKDNDSYLAVALATELNFYIAQRNADVLKLQDKDIYKKGDNYFFNINQNKVDNVNVKVPIPPHLVEEVLSKKGYIIADRFGKFDVQRFSRYFKKIRDILGFDERYIFKNMRHTGSTAYVEAGVATNAIISITGHTNEAIFNQVYKGNTEEVTLPALKKRLEAESRNNKIKESE